MGKKLTQRLNTEKFGGGKTDEACVCKTDCDEHRMAAIEVRGPLVQVRTVLEITG